MNSFNNLVETVISKADTITVSSICPQSNQYTQYCLDAVNAGIPNLCADMSCTFCNMSDVIKLADGTIRILRGRSCAPDV